MGLWTDQRQQSHLHHHVPLVAKAWDVVETMIESVRKHHGGFGIDCFGYLEWEVGGIGGCILELSQLWYKARKSGLTGTWTA